MNHSSAGFTLVEVLLAIAIFVTLTAMGWMVFDQILKNRDRNAQHSQALVQLQMAYAQVLRDFSQAVPVVGTEDEQLYAALRLQNDRVQFNRAGVIDPLNQGLDQLQYVEYSYDANKKALIRYQHNGIYRKQQQLTQGSVILAPIENLNFQALDPAILQRWPETTVSTTDADAYLAAQLPRGVQLSFDYQGQSYRWVFSLVRALPQQLSAETTTSTSSTDSATQSSEN